jgi:opacity protein-like surface antigen
MPGTLRISRTESIGTSGEHMSARDALQRGIVVFLCVAAPAFPAAAQTIQGFYIRADAGWSKTADANLQDVNFAADHVITGPGGTRGILSDYGGAWLLGGGAGVQFTPHFRGDIVYTYRGTYRLDHFDEASLPSNFRGNISSNSVMATGYADFPIGDSGVAPFIGVGVGWASNSLDSLSWQPAVSANIKPALRTLPGGTADGVAWQAALGVSFLLTNVLTLDLAYRYFSSGDVRTAAGNIVANGAVIGTYSGARGSLVSDEIVVSLRYRFGSL